MIPATDSDFLRGLLLATPLLLHAVAGATFGHDAAAGWRRAQAAALAALGAALGSALLLGLRGAFVVEAGGASLRGDAVGATLLVLVTFIGWVIVRYSARYLEGDPRQTGYGRALAAVLAAVCAVAVTDHLAVLVAAWLGTSLALHRLLTHCDTRPAARLAAHKKFVASRLADAALLAALALLWSAFGTLRIGELAAAAAAPGGLPAAAHAALALVVLAALLKCAALPMHGWLIQVMEAPTPVSALLHAGVVNLGGFVLIRLAALVAEAPAAQVLLVAVGGVTAVVAALVTTTRISVKVALAWSTCAQMGFMLLQCGLGAWELALLHLVAHSLYKAHAFLSAGGAVQRAAVQQLAPPPPAPVPLAHSAAALAGAALAVGAVAALAHLAGAMPAPDAATGLLAGVLCVALVPLLSAPMPAAARLQAAAAALAFTAAAFALHGLAAGVLGPLPRAALPLPLLGVVGALFAALLAVQSVLRAAPHGALARRLYPLFYAGLYLDEAVTRRLLRAWPLPDRASSGGRAA